MADAALEGEGASFVKWELLQHPLQVACARHTNSEVNLPTGHVVCSIIAKPAKVGQMKELTEELCEAG